MLSSDLNITAKSSRANIKQSSQCFRKANAWQNKLRKFIELDMQEEN
jgi:hypothetical protein